MLLEFVVFNGNYQVWATSRFLFEFLPGTKIRPYSEINTFQPSLTYVIDESQMRNASVPSLLFGVFVRRRGVLAVGRSWRATQAKV